MRPKIKQPILSCQVVRNIFFTLEVLFQMGEKIMMCQFIMRDNPHRFTKGNTGAKTAGLNARKNHTPGT
jgi:hypothetical protein